MSFKLEHVEIKSSLQRSKMEKLEIEAQLDALRMEKQSVNTKGNSLFSEVRLLLKNKVSTPRAVLVY